MPYVEHFRVEESLVVTGTGAVTTGATPVAGSQTFADAAAIGDTFPLWIVDSTASPPTIEASLGTYSAANTLTRTLVPGGSAALVTFLGNACSVFIARIPGGNVAQVFNAAQATSGTEVVTLAQAQADFAAINGLSTQVFNAAAAVSGTQVINLTQANGLYPALKTNLPASTDLNTVLTSGFYNIESSPVNGPSGVAYSEMIVASNGGKCTQQITYYITGVVYERTINISGATFGQWNVLPNLGYVQANFAPIAQNNAPVDRNLAGDLIATVYTNATAQVWTDYITPDGTGATDITVNGVQILSSATEIMTVTIPPGGTIELTTTQPTGWFRVVM